MIVEAENVSMVVGGEVLLPPLTFGARSGEIVALRGPNGSGKTTLLRVLSGSYRPTSGKITIDGTAISDRDAAFRRRVAALIGLPPLARDLTLVEHVRLVRASWGHLAGEDESPERLLERLGLDGLSSRFPHELSSGQTQLFALALTLARPSELLLFDEPEQRLDGDRMEHVKKLLVERVATGCLVIMATHSDLLVDGTGSRTVLLPESHR